MAFLFRQRSEALPEDEVRLLDARRLVEDLERAAIGPDGRDDTPRGTRQAASHLADIATQCASELDDAEWRFRKGDSIGGQDRLEHVTEMARDGLRAISDHEADR